MNRPKWWDGELEITPHVEKRMIQRSFTEVELREMFRNYISQRKALSSLSLLSR